MYHFESKKNDRFIVTIAFTLFTAIFVFVEAEVSYVMIPITVAMWGNSLFVLFFGRVAVTFDNGVLSVNRMFSRRIYHIDDFQRIKYHSDSEGYDWITGVWLENGKRKKEIILKDKYQMSLKEMHEILQKYLNEVKRIDAIEMQQLNKEIEVLFNESLPSISLLISLGMSFVFQIFFHFNIVLVITGIISFVVFALFVLMRRKVIRYRKVEMLFTVIGVITLAVTLIAFLTGVEML